MGHDTEIHAIGTVLSQTRIVFFVGPVDADDRGEVIE